MDKPLLRRTIVITRPRLKSGGAAAALAANGAHVVFAPLIRTVPPRSWKALDRAIKGLRRYDAVAFTSANAVDFFFLRCRKLLAKKKPVSPRILAAVGRATAKAVFSHGWSCTVVPEDARSEGLAKVLRVPRGSRVLMPRAERGLDTLPRMLRKKGAVVDVPAAYRTIPDPEGLRALRSALALGADAVTFASPSAAVLAVPYLKISGAAAIAIGPTTASALRAKGVIPAAVSERPDAESFARAVEKGLRGRP